jgi:hypothetical protein
MLTRPGDTVANVTVAVIGSAAVPTGQAARTPYPCKNSFRNANDWSTHANVFNAARLSEPRSTDKSSGACPGF